MILVIEGQTFIWSDSTQTFLSSERPWEQLFEIFGEELLFYLLDLLIF